VVTHGFKLPDGFGAGLFGVEPGEVVHSGLNYLGFCSDPYRRIGATPRQYSPEFRQRALRLLDTTMEASDISEFEAIKSVASKLDISEESLRRWRRKA
jgi:transposase